MPHISRFALFMPIVLMPMPPMTAVAEEPGDETGNEAGAAMEALLEIVSRLESDVAALERALEQPAPESENPEVG